MPITALEVNFSLKKRLAISVEIISDAPWLSGYRRILSKCEAAIVEKYECRLSAIAIIQINTYALFEALPLNFTCSLPDAKTKKSESTIEANKRFFASADDVPRQAYTMGIGTIMAARKIVVVVSGEDKAEIVKKAFTGPVTPKVPASILQMHPDVTVVCDAAAY